MKWKSWIRQYVVHIAVCIGIFTIAFGTNQKINLERSHIYTVEETNQTILKEITEARTEGDVLVFSGWSFDTNYYNGDSKCELILQDTETGEALWLKMKKNVKPVEIDDRYTGGGDYSRTGFRGNIKVSKLKVDSVYEILLRYSCEYSDENGNKQKYVKTVTTDEFIYQGETGGYEMAEYNPKTFQAPEIAGTGLEKELKGAKLFHYFQEGMWIYYDEANVYYIAETEKLEWDKNPKCPVHWFVRNMEDLPEDRQEYGFGNSDFYIKDKEVMELENSNYTMAKVAVPNNNMTHFISGLYYDDTGWKYCCGKQWKW